MHQLCCLSLVLANSPHAMLKHIHALEALSRRLEPSPEQRLDWGQSVWKYATTFLDHLEKGKAYESPKQQYTQLPDPAEEPRQLSELLEWLQTEVDQSGINPASGGHLGYVPGGGVFPTALADFLAAVTNRYSGIFFANPGAVRIENQMLRWMCRLVGYPSGALGNLASGGSVATLTAITAARDHCGIRSRDVERAVIYLTQQVHHCVHKAIRIAGLAEAIVRFIPTNSQYKMDPAALERQIKADNAIGLKPFLVVASAGTTDTGAIDPLEEIADIAQAHQLWFHVDAAYGGAFLLVAEFKKAFKGIERSDSIVIDPHKGFFLAYGLGAVLVSEVQTLYQSQYYQASYMQDAQPNPEEWSPADLSPELTKHFRGLRFWLSLQLLGLTPFRAALEEKVYLCRYFYERIQTLGFEVGPYPDLSIMIYRYIPAKGNTDSFNAALVQWVQQNGTIFISSTTLNGNFWIRLAVVNFRTHLQQIETCLEILEKGVAAITQTTTE